jgi:arabinofuranosyltransferase
MGAAAWPYTVDDAYVVARYADHLVAGHGYAMNPGGPVTDGVTGLLWIVPMALGVPVAKGVGLASAAFAAGLATHGARRRGGAWAAGATAVFVGVQPTLGVWGVAGLETGLATLAVTVVVLAAAGYRNLGWPVVGMALGVIPWLRPEAVPVTWVAVALLWARDGQMGRKVSAMGLVGLVAVAACRMVWFGHPLPLSMAAKPPVPVHGLTYVGHALVATAGPVAVVLAAVACRWAREVRVLALLVGVHLVVVVLAGGDWMPGYRLVSPVLPALAVLVGVGAARLRLHRALVLGIVALACALPVADAVAQLPEAREAGRLRREVGRPLALWMGGRFEHVALVDAGYLPWVSGVRVLDLAGLTDPRVARAPGGHLDKRFDPAILAVDPPDAILLHSRTWPPVDGHGRLMGLAGYPVEQRVAALPWVRAHYRVARVLQYAPGYHYVVLTPRGRERPAAGVSPGRPAAVSQPPPWRPSGGVLAGPSWLPDRGPCALR